MDLTGIVVGLASAVITAAVPLVVTLAYVYGKRAVAALETSRYAEAYSRLDPIVQNAIEAAADEALRRAVDATDRFNTGDVKSHIAKSATEALNALGDAAGVRVDLQYSHVNTLIDLAADEVLTTLADLEGGGPTVERSVSPAGEAFGARDAIDERFAAYDTILNDGPALSSPRRGYDVPLNYDPGVPQSVAEVFSGPADNLGAYRPEDDTPGKYHEAD